jgi:hypothetical protein
MVLATMMIELDGSLAGNSVDGLRINSCRCTVRGLVINRFAENGIYVEPDGKNVIAASGEHGIEHHCIQSSGENNRILGNYIGTDASGTTAFPNMGSGISLGQYAFSHTIGGVVPGEGNVVAGNTEHGIDLHDPMGLTHVLGNRIGVGADACRLAMAGTASSLCRLRCRIRLEDPRMVPGTLLHTMGGQGSVWIPAVQMCSYLTPSIRTIRSE